MKKLIYTATIVFTALLLTIMAPSCAGEEGPMGQQGPKGEQGIQGIPGVAGKDGGMFYSGNGAPTSTLGKNGDMYLDRTTATLYGPKSDSGWGTPLNLKGATGAKGDRGSTGAKGDKGETGATGAKGDRGATGAKGADGSKILRGATNPAANVGTTGDYYLNTTTGDLFGPKTATSWGTPINLKGTANVISSTWVQITKWDSGSNNSKHLYYSIPTPFINAVASGSTLKEITEGGGVILVYLKETFSGGSYLLPATNLDLLWQGKVAYFSFGTGFTNRGNNDLVLMVHTLDGSNLHSSIAMPTSSARLRLFFKYVIIPAGRQVNVSGTLKNVGDVHWNAIEFDKVKEMLQLNE